MNWIQQLKFKRQGKNIESVTHPNDNDARFFYERGMPNYNDTMDYKKIETILNRRRLSIGF